MLKKKRKLILIITILFVIASILFFVVKHIYNLKNYDVGNITGEITIPKNTQVIINFSTMSDTRINRFPTPLLQTYYFDKNGSLQNSFEIKDECLGDFIVEDGTNIAYFLCLLQFWC